MHVLLVFLFMTILQDCCCDDFVDVFSFQEELFDLTEIRDNDFNFERDHIGKDLLHFCISVHMINICKHSRTIT